MKVYHIQMTNPVKLDVTYASDGTCVQYNGDTKQWLAYDSKEMINYRQKCLEEYNQLFQKSLQCP